MTLARKQIFIANGYYHIYNRGHNKQVIFHTPSDYSRYITRLTQYLQKHAVTLLAYCLMPNHLHLLIRQDGDETIEKFIHRLHTAYTMYFNKKYRGLGAVFQGRFKARPVETDEYLLHVSRYIHLNPLEILRSQALGLRLSEYKWSSYAEYTNNQVSPIGNPSIVLDYFGKRNSVQNDKQYAYKHFVEDTITDIADEKLAEISNGSI